VARLRQAADQARGRGAPEVAARCLRRALAEPPREAARVEVLFELGQIETMQDPAAAVSDLGEALAGSSAGPRQAAIALALGEALTLAGRLGEAIPVFDRGLAQPTLEPSELRASLEAGLLAAARWEPSAQELRRRTVNGIRRRDALGERIDPQLHSQLAIEAAAEGVDRAGAIRHARAALAAAEQLTSSASAVPESALVLTFAEPGRDGTRCAVVTRSPPASSASPNWPRGGAPTTRSPSPCSSLPERWKRI